VSKHCCKKELSLIARTNRTALSAPYVIQKKHVDQVVKALDAALRKNAETTHKKEKAAPAAPGS